MKLLLAKPRGFCAGVVRAIETVEKVLKIHKPPIWVRHHIVHNEHVVKRLEKQGVIFVENLDEVPEGKTVIYSAHGVSPEVRSRAKKRNLIEIDATCGLVTRVHFAVKMYASRGYKIILIGHKNHVEIIGAAGEAPESTVIIDSIKDVDNLKFSKNDKLFYISQTTFSIDDIKDIANRLKSMFPNIETLPASSICYATTNRQMALKEVAKQADIALIVGDPSSSNSNRLKETAKNCGIRAYLINSEEEILKEWFVGVNVIGLTAGASTPEDIVQKCIDRLYEYGVSSSEDVVFTQENVSFELPI